MTKIPEQKNTTVNQIYEWYGKQDEKEPLRGHLGASAIGNDCLRALWNKFRWVVPQNNAKFPGRILRLFDRGKEEEFRFIKELEGIGCKMSPLDPETGEQFRFTDHGGHFAGSADGIVTGIPEAPKTPHLVEFKTSNDSNFSSLEKDGIVTAKPEHYAQMIVYMEKFKLARGLYLVTNKNNDHIYQERIKEGPKFAARLIKRAKIVIESSSSLEKISEDPSWFTCKFCDFHPFCHTDKVIPAINCRTCIWSVPIINPKGQDSAVWACSQFADDNRYGLTILTLGNQTAGCGSHLWIPELLENSLGAALLDGLETDKDGFGIRVHYENGINEEGGVINLK